MRVCNICGCSLCNDILLQTTHIIYDEWHNPYEVCDECYKEVIKPDESKEKQNRYSKYKYQ